MSSRFPGGGGPPEFYNNATVYGGGGARSIMNLSNTSNNSMINNTNNNNNNFQLSSLDQQIPLTTNYRSQIFLDQQQQQQPYHQISNNSFIGKRTLAEFQNHHNHNYNHHQQQQYLQPQQQFMNLHQNQALANLLIRSVKQRIVTSPISPMDFPQQRYGSSSSSALLQQLRSNSGQVNNPMLSVPPPSSVSNDNISSSSQVDDSEQMMTRLQELEKQLLGDFENDDDVSVITNNNYNNNTNSEWSETIQSLISGTNVNVNPVSPSPSSSSCSSSSTTVSSSPASSNACYSKQALLDAAASIAEGKIDEANEILNRQVTVTTPVSNSEQKLMEFLSLALKSRVNSFENAIPVAELYSEKHTESTQLLYDISPCFKLGFMAANLAILDAIIEQPNNIDSFHVVDFDIGKGGQYMNLLHAISARRKEMTPFTLKVTAVADNDNEEILTKVGDILSKFAIDASIVGVNLSFNVVKLSQKLSDLTRESLGCTMDEPIAVNFAFKLYKMPDESVSTENPRDELLRRVKGLSPIIMTVIEQEMNTNTAPLTGRVNEVCSYYGALLDSIDMTVPRESLERVKVEEGLSRRLVNSVSFEGRQRIERCEVFGKWRARMGMAGFELKKMSSNVAESMRARIVSGNRVNPGFTVKEDNGVVCFGWKGKTLTVASAWR
ncbi:hypothetical protein ACFE04_027099 [Oxalis oulophora]